jgi:hypothetical protein
MAYLSLHQQSGRARPPQQMTPHARRVLPPGARSCRRAGSLSRHLPRRRHALRAVRLDFISEQLVQRTPPPRSSVVLTKQLLEAHLGESAEGLAVDGRRQRGRRCFEAAAADLTHPAAHVGWAPACRRCRDRRRRRTAATTVQGPASASSCRGGSVVAAAVGGRAPRVWSCPDTALVVRLTAVAAP